MKTVNDDIRTIVDFPHEGINFREVATLFADLHQIQMTVDQLLLPSAGLVKKPAAAAGRVL